jgi:oligoribonuclease (3'-5' exoribonuclease)
LIELIEPFCKDEKLFLCGNQIENEKQFIQNNMSKLGQYFHEQNLEFNTTKQLCSLWFPNIMKKEPKKSNW